MRCVAPGRVNLIGDHTDYLGGLVLPMAIQLVTTFDGERGGGDVRLWSDERGTTAVVPLDVADPAAVHPDWARYVAGVVWALRPSRGLNGRLSTTLPLEAGLSSSAALEVAVALALGFEGTATELALACQRAEYAATGVPCGVMDQLASVAGLAGHALLIDCTSLSVRPVALPPGAEVVVVHSGERRRVAASAYAERRRQCEAAERVVGPLVEVGVEDVARLADPVLRARARHVVTENDRVRRFADALESGDLAACGRLMVESHESLRRDFEVSTPRLDALVARLRAAPGVYGARLTGAGFGGCAVALCRPWALRGVPRMVASAGARVVAPGPRGVGGPDAGTGEHDGPPRS